MDALEMALLFDCYGGLLTQRQRDCFDMRYNQDLSLGEIGQVLSISRQAVYDNLTRGEAILRKMEENTGCVSRCLRNRRAVTAILDAARQLQESSDSRTATLAEQILSAARDLEE